MKKLLFFSLVGLLLISGALLPRVQAQEQSPSSPFLAQASEAIRDILRQIQDIQNKINTLLQQQSQNASRGQPSTASPTTVPAQTQNTTLNPTLSGSIVLDELPNNPTVFCNAILVNPQSTQATYLIQLVLKQANFYPEGFITGYYGRLTRAAVMRLQQANNLPVTGGLDKATLGAIAGLLPQQFSECTNLTANQPPIPILPPTPSSTYNYSSTTASTAPFDESSLLAGLNPEAQNFFRQSMQIRSGYPESNAYKHFQRDRDGNGVIDQMDQFGYLHLKPINNDYVPNPVLYSNIPPTPALFYRYVKDCQTKITIERQMIDTSGGYRNYIGGDRYYQQCILDGSFDDYYIESLTPLEGNLPVTTSTNASITVISPNGGETWQSESTQVIKWSSSNLGSLAINIGYQVNGQIYTIANNVSNTGSYNWTIPTSFTPGSYLLSLMTNDCCKPTAAAFSAAPFSIISLPTVTLNVNGQTVGSNQVKTSGAETIPYNTAEIIAWTSTNASSCNLAASPSTAAWSGTVGTSGSQSTGNLTVSEVYNVTCSGSGGSATTAFTIYVSPQSNPLPSITSINPNQGGLTTSFTISGTNLTSGGNPAIEFYASNGSLAGTAYFVSMGYISSQNITFKPNAANTTLQPGVYQIDVLTPIGKSNQVSFTLTPFSVNIPASVLTVGQTYKFVWSGSNPGVTLYSVYLVGGSLGQIGSKYLGQLDTSYQDYFSWTVPSDVTPASSYQLQFNGAGATGANSPSFSIISQ